jgi:hypothetical protein
VVARATEELERAATILADLEAPEARIAMLRSRLQQLDGGVLTRYERMLWSREAVAAESRATPRACNRKVLVSYSRDDTDVVDRLLTVMDERLVDVWIDRRAVTEGSFVGAINDALAGVADFVLVWSQAATRSKWVLNELFSAVALRNAGQEVTIRPLVLDESTLPPIIADIIAVSAAHGSIEQAAAVLVDRITSDRKAAVAPLL